MTGAEHYVIKLKPPTTAEDWLTLAIQHYKEARGLIGEFNQHHLDGNQKAADHTYKIAAHETQAGILAATVADAMINQTLAFAEPVSGPPIDWEKGL